MAAWRVLSGMEPRHRPILERLRASASALAAVFAVLLSPGPARGQQPSLDAYVTRGIDDLRASVVATNVDAAAVEKINRDFASLYRLRKLTVFVKAPDRFRFENEIGVYIVNGSTRYYSVAALKLRKRDDLGPLLSKRPSLLDMGVLTPSVVANLDARFVRAELLAGTSTAVFDVTFRQEDSVRYRLWLDEKTRVIVRREWRDGAGKLRATFVCGEAREAKPGIWLPTRIEVRNAEGSVAGVLSYSDTSLNSGLDESLFSIPR